jgi:Tfp pilus assembly protein FimV
MYCDDHGNAQYCAECLRPESALPSFNLYRGALLTMLAGTALAVFFIVRPPGDSGGASPVLVGRSNPTPSSNDDEPTIAAETPVVTNTPRPTATPTVSPFLEYTIVEGDTLYDIAEANLQPGDNLDAFARAIADLNGLNFDAPTLTPGAILLLPKFPAPTAEAADTPTP